MAGGSKKRTYNGRLSIPLDFDDALKAALEAKPPPKPPRKSKRKKSQSKP